MKILIEETIIETREIANVYDVEAKKQMFLNREAGFFVVMIDGTKHKFSQDIDYDSYPSEIGRIKNMWHDKMVKVIEKWNQDKVEIPVI